MREGLIIIFLWIIVCIIGFVLYKEIEQTMKQREMCTRYDLSPSEFRESCNFNTNK